MKKYLSNVISLTSIASIAVLILLAACGGPKKALISNAEIDTAYKQGSLANLYDRVDNLVKTKKGSEKKEAIEVRSRIVTLLVGNKSTEVDKVISQHEKDKKSVTRKQLLDLKQSLAPAQTWSSKDFEVLTKKVDSALSVTNKLISQSVAFSKKKAKGPVENILALKQAADLAGEGQPESIAYEEANTKALDGFLNLANKGMLQREYAMAIKAAEKGLKLDPGNIKFESIVSQATAGLFEKDFRSSLENGKPELAYQALSKISDKSVFSQVKKSMGRSILVLADYFARNAEKAYKSGYIATAYQDFKKARNVQEKLSISPQGFIQEKAFVDLVMVKARDTSLGQGKRLAYMSVVNEFDPNYPRLKSEYLKLRRAIEKRALTKLSVADFKEVRSTNSVVTSVGRRISSKLEKMMFEKLASEVLVVTNSNNNRVDEYQGLFLQLDGEVLQAAIERTANQGQRTKKVQTGVNRVETEEYIKWKKRKKGEAPKQFNETPIYEEVSLKVEHVQKQAIAEVAYRIVEPSSGKILLANNLVKENEFKGESINEYQKGDFKQSYVKADLPSDIKIMDTLSTELANGLGEKLIQYLKSPEDVFYQKYLDAKNQGDKNKATEYLANALIIAENKKKETADWSKQLKSISL